MVNYGTKFYFNSNLPVRLIAHRETPAIVVFKCRREDVLREAMAVAGIAPDTPPDKGPVYYRYEVPKADLSPEKLAALVNRTLSPEPLVQTHPDDEPDLDEDEGDDDEAEEDED